MSVSEWLLFPNDAECPHSTDCRLQLHFTSNQYLPNSMTATEAAHHQTTDLWTIYNASCDPHCTFHHCHFEYVCTECFRDHPRMYCLSHKQLQQPGKRPMAAQVSAKQPKFIATSQQCSLVPRLSPHPDEK